MPTTSEIIERQMQRLYDRLNDDNTSNDDRFILSVMIANLSKLRDKYDKEDK